jgi:hypothetical protein
VRAGAAPSSIASHTPCRIGRKVEAMRNANRTSTIPESGAGSLVAVVLLAVAIVVIGALL